MLRASVIDAAACVAVIAASIAAGCGAPDRPPPAPVSWRPVDDEPMDGSTTGSVDLGTTGDVGGSDDGEVDPLRFDVGGGADVGEPAPTGTFEPEQPFGDDPRELDLVGVWGIPAYGNPQTVEASLAIDDDGAVRWLEHDEACDVVTLAYGVAWVEGSKLVLHVDQWLGDPPWDEGAVNGYTPVAPFRLRLGHARIGAYLGLSAFDRLTHSVAWTGRAYLRLSPTSGPVGSWASDAELWALVPGEDEAVLVVRDRFDATVAADGTATMSTRRTYWWPSVQPLPPIEQSGAWIDGTPGAISGVATIVDAPHAYDAAHLTTFGAWNVLRRDPVLRCPEPDDAEG